MIVSNKKQTEYTRKHELRLLKIKAKYKKFWKRLTNKRIRRDMKQDLE